MEGQDTASGTQTDNNQHFLDRLKYLAATKPDDEAFVFLSTDKPRDALTWKELYIKSTNVAKALMHIGVRRGEIVAVSIRTSPEWLFIAIGAMFMGALPINLVFTYKDGRDVVAMMKKLETCSFLALDPGHNLENWNIFKTLIDETSEDGTVRSSKMPSLRYLICHDPAGSIPGVKMFSDWMKEHQPDEELPTVQLSDTAFIFQTSGSTGYPKAVPYTFDALTSLTRVDVGVDNSLTQYNDRPFGWMGGFPFGIMYGQKRVTLSGFSPPPTDKVDFLIKAFQTEDCKLIVMLAAGIAELLARKEQFQDLNWPVEYILTGGQPLTSQVMQAINVICRGLLVGYGATEFNFVACLNITDPDTYEDMNCGKPLKGIEVKIVDDQEKEVSVNTPGEIYVRSEWKFSGYYNDPEKTKSVMTDDGWFKTGDIGKFSESSDLFVLGRKSNEIIRGGMNISPEILESVLRNCPLVEYAVVVPIPDKVLYQEICACVKLKPNVEAGEADIRAYCEEVHADTNRMFSYLPAHYLILNEFPFTNTGKDARSQLTQQVLEMLNIHNVK